MAENTEKSAYDVLEVPKGATFDEIKANYYELVKKFDPERYTDRFIILNRAFTRLSKPESRAQEDVYSFNTLQAEFAFSPEEHTPVPDDKIEAALDGIKAKKAAGEISTDEAKAKVIQILLVRACKNIDKVLWDKAVQDLKTILQIDLTHRRAKQNLLSCYVRLGAKYADHELYDEALEVWSQAVQMNPDDPLLIHNLALAADRAGQDEKAARYWQETVKRWQSQLERDPDDEFLKNSIIEVLRKHGDRMSSEKPNGGAHGTAPASNGTVKGGASAPARGIDEYREILKLNPNDFEAQFKIASLLMQQHQWPEAIKELDALRLKFPRNIEVMNLLGWALLNYGKVDEGFRMWQKAKIVDPKNYQLTESLIKAHLTMGRTLREQGLYTNGLVHFKAVMKYMPDNSDVHYEIGKTYQLKGDERSAYMEYQKTLQLNPKHKEARHGLSSLKLRR